MKWNQIKLSSIFHFSSWFMWHIRNVNQFQYQIELNSGISIGNSVVSQIEFENITEFKNSISCRSSSLQTYENKQSFHFHFASIPFHLVPRVESLLAAQHFLSLHIHRIGLHTCVWMLLMRGQSISIFPSKASSRAATVPSPVSLFSFHLGKAQEIQHIRQLGCACVRMHTHTDRTLCVWNWW